MTSDGDHEPIAELHPDFSSPGATATRWADARRLLESARVYWLSTVRPDGRPHVTPIAGVMLDDRFCFTTGPTERKAHNLARNSQVVVTTGSNVMDGLDVVIEGEAVRLTDPAVLERLASGYPPKYGDLFVFEVRDGALRGAGTDDDDDVLAYEVRPRKAFGFGKGGTFSQTKWRFE